MTWVRIDDAMPEHPKLLAAGPLAFALDVAAICYSARNGTNGRIPRAKVRLLLDLSDVRIGRAKVDPIALAEKLVECGRWHRDGDDYVIHDFAEYNFTREETEDRALELREKRRAAGRLGGLRRAQCARSNGEANADPVASKTEANAKQNRSNPEANDEAKAKQTPSKTEAPIPIPIPGSHTHSPPNPPQADADEAKLPSKTQVRPVVTAQPRAMDEAILDQETRQILEAIRSYDVLRVAATPELASRIGGRQMARGTPIRVILEAIDQCARTAESQAAVGAPWDAPRIADQLMRYCERAAVDWKSGPREGRQRPRSGGLPPVQPQAKPGQYDWRKDADAKRAERLRELEEAAAQLPMALGGGS